MYQHSLRGNWPTLISSYLWEWLSFDVGVPQGNGSKVSMCDRLYVVFTETKPCTCGLESFDARVMWCRCDARRSVD